MSDIRYPLAQVLITLTGLMVIDMKKDAIFIAILSASLCLNIVGHQVLVFGVSAQCLKDKEPSPLVLRGKVVKTEKTRNLKHGIGFDVTLDMEILNKGSIPALLLNHEILIIGEELSSSLAELEAGKRLYVCGHPPSVNLSSKWLDMRSHLDKSNPPSDQILVLAPGASWKFEAKCALNFYFKTLSNGIRKEMGWDEIQKFSSTLLQVTIQAWPVNLDMAGTNGGLLKGTPFGKKLQKRWRNQGYLWLEDLESEPIELKLGEQDREREKEVQTPNEPNQNN